jgi:hypothetical protein
MERELTTALVKRFIQDADRVRLSPGREYHCQTRDHALCWPKIQAALERAGERGLAYATVKAMGGSNKDYAAYLIGALGVLRCPLLEERLAIGATG